MASNEPDSGVPSDTRDVSEAKTGSLGFQKMPTYRELPRSEPPPTAANYRAFPWAVVIVGSIVLTLLLYGILWLAVKPSIGLLLIGLVAAAIVKAIHSGKVFNRD
jgi:hypothetical protein